jgi:hypothetical protein
MEQREFDFDKHRNKPDAPLPPEAHGQRDTSPAKLNFSTLDPKFASAIDALKNDPNEGSPFFNEGRHGALKTVITFLAGKPDSIALSRGIEALNHCLAFDESISLRKAVMREVPKIRPPLTALNFMREAIIATLDRDDTSYAPEVALKAVDTLVELKGKPLFSELFLGEVFETDFENIFLSAVENSSGENVTSEVAARCGLMLSAFKNNKYIKMVEQIVTEGHSSKPILIQAIKSVGPDNLRLKDLAPELIKFLDDSRHEVQREARYQLVRYHSNFLAGYSGSQEGEIAALKKYLNKIYGM